MIVANRQKAWSHHQHGFWKGKVIWMRRTSGFTLIELLVVIAIIAILAAILFPVFARAREKARQSSCQSNEKQLMLAYLAYIQDYDERTPNQWFFSSTGGTGYTWVDALMPYVKNLQLFDCPSAGRRTTLYTTPNGLGFIGVNSGSVSYGINTCYWGGYAGSASGPPANNVNGRNLGLIKVPAETVTFLDWTYTEYGNQYDISANIYNMPPADPPYRHNEMANVSFVDGHVKAYPRGGLAAQHVVNGVGVYYLFTIQED
jgi:prepilin-type N-terminal cleavage/methylation domain-containing protein/prepilin-type processing-associated H-X9-DG protein